ncbi:MAG: 2-phospho-L-lactate guanylyltransferase [Terracidiphilus sp.]
MEELVFEVAQEADGGYTAEALGESIFTQADTWEELRANVREAVAAFYFDSAPPTSVRLRLVRDEVLAVA